MLNNTIPKALDQPERFLLLELDQLVVGVSVFGVGMAFDVPTIGIILAIWVCWGFGKLKNGKHPRFLLHLLYWYTPSYIAVRLRGTPPSFMRSFFL